MSSPVDMPRRWEGRAILHVDLDAFFASVEQLDHPEWRGLPVIVGGSPDGRGVVSTASYEARRYGIGSAMPAARAARLAPPETVWAAPRFERYKELSDAVFAIFRDTTPHVQVVSVDEAFLDVGAGSSTADPVTTAEDIRGRVAALGLTCSVGVATSKTVAKIASDAEKPDGLTVVRAGEERAFLAPLPIRAMSGIGPKTASRLHGFGLHTLGDLAALDEPAARDLLGTHGPMLVARCRGEDVRPVSERDPVKSVSNERTFSADVRDPEAVHSAILSLADRVGRRMRRKGVAGRTVNVKVRFADFTTRTVQRTLETATDEESVIGPIAEELVRTVWSPGVGVRLLGVGVSGLGDVTEQLDLFAAAADEAEASDDGQSRDRRLALGLDAVRERFGESAIVRGSRALSPESTGTPSTTYQSDDIEDADVD